MDSINTWNTLALFDTKNGGMKGKNWDKYLLLFICTMFPNEIKILTMNTGVCLFLFFNCKAIFESLELHSPNLDY